MRVRLEALPNAIVHWIKDYPEFLWSDTAVHHTEEMASTVLRFLQRMDEEDTLPTVSVSGTGEVAGVTYTCSGLQSKWVGTAISAFSGPHYGSWPLLVIVEREILYTADVHPVGRSRACDKRQAATPV
jgi:hypothetical protein